MKRVGGDRRKTSIEWPADVDDRLRLLVALAEQAGEAGATSASELLAALVCDQSLDGARLAAVISSYRSAGRRAVAGDPAAAAAPRQRRRGRPRRGAGDESGPAAECLVARPPPPAPAARLEVGRERGRGSDVAVSWATSAATRKSMQANRRRDTRPELAIRRLVHASGLRYRVDARPLKSARHTADLIFTKARVAVFIDGCWWHGCPEHYRPPSSNASYWAGKVARNRERDRLADGALAAAGWAVIRIWEHEPPAAAASRIETAVRAARSRPAPKV